MISCRDWWPWTKPSYNTMIRRQSNNQWIGSITAQPSLKIPSAKIRWKSSRLDFWGSRRHPPHWLSSKGPNYQRRVLSSLLVQFKDILKGKRSEEFPKGSCSCTTMPRLTKHCNPEKTGLPELPVSWSPTLFNSIQFISLSIDPFTRQLSHGCGSSQKTK